MENEAVSQSAPFHVFARLLSGDTKTLLFNTSRVCARAVKERIFDFTRIPIPQQRLIYGGHQIKDSFVIPFPDSTVHLCLRLRGGKGGFGSLLRGAATKAGQKKTNNFDACRDMSGRRLRHVNAEKKLEEWQAGAEERKLEKIAEEFIKKASKKGKKGAGDGEAEKYVEKYRKESAACVARVELSVREAVGSSGALKRNMKRKLSTDAGVDGKKLKIWMGKRKMAGSDDDMDEDSSEDDEKSVLLNKPNSSDSAKDEELSSDTITKGRQDEKITAFGSSGSGSEEEKDTIVQDNSDSDGCSFKESKSNENNGKVEPVIEANKVDHVSCLPSPKEVATAENDAVQVEDEQRNNFHPGKSNEKTSQVTSNLINDESITVVELPSEVDSVSENKAKPVEETISDTAEKLVEEKPLNLDEFGSASDLEVFNFPGLSCAPPSEVDSVSENKAKPAEETVSDTAEKLVEEKPLNLDEFGSASDLQVLGLERLKVELQIHGLKCGGTLQERAARLFFLKSTPLDKIPKKLLAKK